MLGSLVVAQMDGMANEDLDDPIVHGAVGRWVRSGAGWALGPWRDVALSAREGTVPQSAVALRVPRRGGAVRYWNYG